MTGKGQVPIQEEWFQAQDGSGWSTKGKGGKFVKTNKTGGGKGKKGDQQWIQGYQQDSYQPSYYGEKGKQGKGKGFWEFPPLKGWMPGKGQGKMAKGKFQGQPPWEAWMMGEGIPGKGPWGMEGNYHWIAGPDFKGSYGTTLDGDRPAKGKECLDGKGKEAKGKGPIKSQDGQKGPTPVPGALPAKQEATDSGRVGAHSKPMPLWDPVHPWTGAQEKPLRDMQAHQMGETLGEAVGAAARPTQKAVGVQGALLHHFSPLSLWTCQCQVYHGTETDSLRAFCKGCAKPNPFLEHIRKEKQAMEAGESHKVPTPK